jgi:hypothetical protein
MVAYSFNPRFAAAIKAGLKCQTIRAARKRHARPGEALQLFTGMRTRHCRRILPDQTCTTVMSIEIAFRFDGRITGITTDGVPVRNLNGFALRDGFNGIEDMSAFWAAAHPEAGPRVWHGVLIEWADPAYVRRAVA